LRGITFVFFVVKKKRVILINIWLFNLIEARLRTGRLVSIPGRYNDQMFFTSPTASRPVLGPTQPPIQWVPGTHTLGVKQQGHEDDHSHPSRAKVKSAWGYTSTLPICFCGVVLRYNTDNFILHFHLYLNIMLCTCVDGVGLSLHEFLTSALYGGYGQLYALLYVMAVPKM